MKTTTKFHLKPLYEIVGDKCCLCGDDHYNDLYVPSMERVSGFGVHGLMKCYRLCFSCYKMNARRKLKDKAPTRFL